MPKAILSLIIVTILLAYPSLDGFSKNITGFTLSLIPYAEAAAVDYFLKIEGVDGESADSKHQGWIEVESYSFGATQSRSGGAGGGAGKVTMQDFHFVMKVNKASPKLFLATATGEHFKKAEMAVVKDGTDVMVYTLSDALISSYQTDSSSDVPMDQFSISFAKIEMEYKQGGSSVKAGWDVKSNKKVDTGASDTGASSTVTKGEPLPPTPTPSTAKKDSDRDGITDDKDRCPSEAETKNGYQDDDGCPDKAPVKVAPIKPKLVLP